MASAVTLPQPAMTLPPQQAVVPGWVRKGSITGTRKPISIFEDYGFGLFDLLLVANSQGTFTLEQVVGG